MAISVVLYALILFLPLVSVVWLWKKVTGRNINNSTYHHISGSSTVTKNSRGNSNSNLKTLDQVPSPPEFDPKLGNLGDLAKAGSLHEYLKHLHEQFGPIAGFRYFDKFVLSLASPDLFKDTNKLFNRPVPLFSLFRPLIGEASIQYANDEDGKNRRKLLDPFFSHTSVKKIFPVFLQAAERCTSRWYDALQNTEITTINLQNDMFDVAIYAITMSAFGSEFTEKEMKILRESYDHCWNEMERSIKGSPIEPGTPREAIFFQHRDAMFDLVQKILDRPRASAEAADDEGRVNKGVGGFLNFMLQQDSFSPDQIKCDTISFLIGGFHTTANFLIWVLYFLSKYPEHQRRVREEIIQLLKGENPTFDAVCGMPYTTAVLNETLRYIVVAPFAGRYSNADEVIGSYLIPKETMMVQALGVVLQDKHYWDSPDQFNPTRFIDSDSSSTPASAQWSFKPFGVGNRMCPASKYAMLETKAVLATLLQKFEFNLLPGQRDVTAEYGLVGQMREELHLQVRFVQ